MKSRFQASILSNHRIFLHYLLALSSLLISSCAQELFRNPVPQELEEVVNVADMGQVRVWGDKFDERWQADVIKSIRDEPKGMFPRGPNGEFQYSGLTLSGGGDHGAFGAGFLKGWSASGSRPVFKVVTGVSTGALIAPFALLGSEYDDTLEEVYTQVTADDIYKSEFLLGAYWRESLASNQPLREMVEEYVTDEVIDAIGEAHRKGQRLLIGTTNFDAQRAVIWSMGAIANSKSPRSYEMFRDIMIASAAIPVLFPPTFIDVEADGETYQEMHVDGGTMGQMIFFGATLDWKEALRQVSGEEGFVDNSTLHVIIDGEIGHHYDVVGRRLVPIANRTIKTLIKVSTMASLYRIYLHSEVSGYDFKFVSMPPDYRPVDETPYDPEEMRRMFRIGYKMGLEKTHWQTAPPDL